jgi:hypothetical protein
MRHSISAGVLALSVLVGCGPASEAAGDIDVTSSALTFIPDVDGAQNPDGVWRYDRFTTCLNGAGHCCPNGFALIGLHAGRDVLKCALVSGGLTDGYIDRDPTRCRLGDTCTKRNGMHSCKAGWVMTGWFQAENDFVCKRPAQQSVDMWSEWLDPPPPYGAQDLYPMHVCERELSNPLTAAMTGVNVSLNRLGCVR